MSARRLSVAPGPLRENTNVASVGGGGARPSRKSFGTALPAGAAASAGPSVKGLALTQLYQTVLKMSTENKINSKNSWQLPLIDHMERIISGDASRGAKQSKVALAVPGGAAPAPPPVQTSDGGLLASADAALLNFARASCTLDASVRIWSCRVDDVWNSSFRVLENIARGGPEEGANDEGAGDENDESGARRNKRGQVHTTASSIDAVDSGLGVWTPGAGTTLEKDRASLLQSHVDTGVVVDPLFSKMSGECGGGSEGGAAGLLLARLPVLGGCMLSFGSGAGADDVDAAPAAGISIVGAAAALDPTLTFALRGLWARAVNLSVDATPSALAARLRALQLAPSIEPLYAALATHTGKAMVAAPPPSAAVSAPPPALLSVQDDAGTASWAASAALAAAAAPVLMSPVSPAASAAERATRTSPFASLDAAALAHAAAVALPLSFAGDADDDANLDWGDEVAGSADGAVAAAPTIDADADETGDSSAEVAWQAVVVETAASARAPSSALLLASFEDADDSAGTGAVPVDLAALAMVPTAVARAGRPPQGAGAAWKPRGATAAATQEAIKKRAPAKRATPRISSADYAVVGAAPPAEMWALGSRAALSLSASARTKMAAAVAAGSADLPPHARLALAATASGVTPANELARWLRFCLREAPKVAAGSWPNDRAPTCATSPALVAALSPQRDATHEDYDDGGDAGGDGGGWSADEWRDAAAPKGGAAMTQGPPAADSPPGSPTIAAAAANEPSLEGPIMDAQRPEGHLVAAGRIVEKIRVRFETTSKRVDVALLKSGFWDALGTARGSGALGRVKHKDVEIAARRGAEARASTWEDASGAARGADKTQSAAAPLVGELTGTALPFSSVIRSLAPANSSQVTVPYYFITLLHLANEHGLHLSASQMGGIDDLSIRELAK